MSFEENDCFHSRRGNVERAANYSRTLTMSPWSNKPIKRACFA